MLILRDGHWYRSKAALQKVADLRLADEPHATPDGYAVLVLDMRGRAVQPRADGTPEVVHRPAALVMQGDHGHDLQYIAGDRGRPELLRVEFAPADLPDLEPLRDYDDLPSSRKDYKVYPRGHKLA